MRKTGLIITYFLLFFSIFRVFLIPIGGMSKASTIAGALNILLALQVLFYSRLNINVFLLIAYAIVMVIPSFLGGLDSSEIIISFLETISPYLIITASTSIMFIKKIGITIPKLKKFIILVTLLLLLGHFLSLIGVPIPSLFKVPIATWGSDNTGSAMLQKIDGRISSFVGTSGPYSLSIAYLFISLSILYKNNKFLILFIGSVVQVLSFSRIGFSIILCYVFFYYFDIIKTLLNWKKRKLSKKNLFIFILVILAISYCIFYFWELIEYQIDRILYLFTFTNDVSNQVRVMRMNDAINQINETIFTPLTGSGTGSTARSIGGNQYESQIYKIFVEWGLIGSAIFLNWFLKTLKISGLKNSYFLDKSYLPLTITIFFNLYVIQAFTSAPVVSSISIVLLTNTISNNSFNKINKNKLLENR